MKPGDEWRDVAAQEDPASGEVPGAGGRDRGIFETSRRELVWVLSMCVGFGLWVVGVSWMLGRGPEAETGAEFVLGLPAWVFWGVALPWAAATLFTIVFAMVGVKDAPLEAVVGEEREEAE